MKDWNTGRGWATAKGYTTDFMMIANNIFEAAVYNAYEIPGDIDSGHYSMTAHMYKKSASEAPRQRWSVARISTTGARTWAAQVSRGLNQQEFNNGIDASNWWDLTTKGDTVAGNASMGSEACAADENGAQATQHSSGAGDRLEFIGPERLVEQIHRKLQSGVALNRRAHTQHMQGHARRNRASGHSPEAPHTRMMLCR